jgi:hypothetical protein
MITAGYDRGKVAPGRSLKQTPISRRRETHQEAGKASATRWLRHPANPKGTYKRSSRFDVDQKATRKRNVFRRR